MRDDISVFRVISERSKQLNVNSQFSAVMGCLSGAILIGLGQLSLNAYHRGKLCKPATAMSLVISLVLTSAMYQRYTDTGKIVPAGVIMAISAMMALFYIWNLIFGPRPSGRTRED